MPTVQMLNDNIKRIVDAPIRTTSFDALAEKAPKQLSSLLHPKKAGGMINDGPSGPLELAQLEREHRVKQEMIIQDLQQEIQRHNCTQLERIETPDLLKLKIDEMKLKIEDVTRSKQQKDKEIEVLLQNQENKITNLRKNLDVIKEKAKKAEQVGK